MGSSNAQKFLKTAYFAPMKQKKYTRIVVDFLKSHPLISVNALEKLLDLPFTSVHQAVSGKRLIPKSHIFKILVELANYGLTLEEGKYLSYNSGVLYLKDYGSDLIFHKASSFEDLL